MDGPGVPWDGYAYASISFPKDQLLLAYYVAGPGQRWSLTLKSFPVSALHP